MTATYQDIESGKIIPLKWREFAKHCTIDYVEGDDLPGIKFQWMSREPAFISSAEAKQLRKAGHEVSEAHLPEPGREYLTWCVKQRHGKAVISNRFFCNFRRYGWCWTSDPTGEAGYAHGVTYANRDFYGLVPQTAEQVIRETMIAAIAQLDVPNHYKYHVGIVPLWEKLYQDALENPSGHAAYAIGGTNGSIYDVVINGEPFEL